MPAPYLAVRRAGARAPPAPPLRRRGSLLAPPFRAPCRSPPTLARRVAHRGAHAPLRAPHRSAIRGRRPDTLGGHLSFAVLGALARPRGALRAPRRTPTTRAAVRGTARTSEDWAAATRGRGGRSRGTLPARRLFSLAELIVHTREGEIHTHTTRAQGAERPAPLDTHRNNFDSTLPSPLLLGSRLRRPPPRRRPRPRLLVACRVSALSLRALAGHYAPRAARPQRGRRIGHCATGRALWQYCPPAAAGIIPCRRKKNK